MFSSPPITSCPQCATQLPPQNEPFSFCLRCRFPLQPIANKYQLLHILGQGGIGTIYLARHIRLAKDNHRVIKIIQTSQHQTEIEQRFLQEVQVTATLSQSNDHIVRIYDDFGHQEALGYYYVMEYLQGMTLREFLDRHGPLTPDEALYLFHQLCDAMAEAHQEGIIHRDLKPENIFLIARKHSPLFVKVIDFGIARTLTHDTDQRTQGILGTPMYMAPEQCLNRDIDARTDLYAMGVILHELLTHHLPFANHEDALQSGNFSVLFAHVWNPVQSMRTRWPELQIPEQLDAIVLQLLAKQPEERFPHVESLRNTLLQWKPFSLHTPPPSLLESLDVTEVIPPKEPLPSSQGSDSNTFAAPPSSMWFLGNANTLDLLDTPPPATSPPESPSFPSLQPLPEETQSPLPPLPLYPTSFLGRSTELQQLKHAFHQKHRWLTLYGAGGVGKSRLAIQYAHHFSHPYPVAYIDLAEAHEPNEFFKRIAHALSIPLRDKTHKAQLQQIGYALAGRGPLLLLLDNADAIVQTISPSVKHWLSLSQTTLVLLTSRERLQDPDAHAIELQPLPEKDALQLFLERAQTHTPHFSLPDDEQKILSKVLEQLDYLPLAIELAAGRSQTLSPQALFDQLAKRFQLLTNHQHNTASRQSTLKGAIDFSWNLLSPWEQYTFAQCAIFRGGFDLDAAESILLPSDDPQAPWLSQQLESLHNKSLLRRQHQDTGPPRFGMYESIRQYALHKLDERQGTPTLEKRHALHFLGLGEELARQTSTHGGLLRLQQLERETSNLVLIFERFLEVQPEWSLRALLTLQPLYALRGSRRRYLKRLEQLLQSDTTFAPEYHIRALRIQGEHARRIGRIDNAHRDFAAALELAETHKFTLEKAEILNRWGNLYRAQNQLTQAQEYHEKALTIFQQQHQLAGQGTALSHLGNIFRMRGEAQKAEEHHLRALQLQRQTGDRRGEGISLGQLGNLYRTQGRTHEATRHYELAAHIHRELNDRNGEAITLNNLGNIHGREGRLRDAETSYKKALSIHRESGDRRGEGIALGQLGNLYRIQGKLHRVEHIHKKALSIQSELHDKRGEGIALNNLANLYRAQGRYWEAKPLHERALQLQQEIQDDRGQGFSWLYLGLWDLEQHELKHAEAPLKEALHAFQKSKAHSFQGVTLGALGTWHRLSSRPEQALQLYQEALQLIQKTERRSEAYIRAYIGVLQADQDERTAAQTSFQIAHTLLTTYHDPLGLQLLEICQAHLDLSYMREAIQFSHQEGQDFHLKKTLQRIDQVERKDFSHSKSMGLSYSASDCSGDIRIALRLLRQKLPPLESQT